jgi:hypothetical protein
MIRTHTPNDIRDPRTSQTHGTTLGAHEFVAAAWIFVAAAAAQTISKNDQSIVLILF